MTHQILKVGILGCGPISQFAHLEACRKAQNVELAGVCDADIQLATKMGSFYDAKEVYSRYEDMLSEPQVQAIIIATADEFHIPASKKAVEAGKHVLVEKPLGTDLQEALELEELRRSSEVVFQVGHMKRFDPGIQQARQFISESLGEMVAYKGWYCDSTHRYDMTDSTQPLPFSGSNRLKPTTDPKSDPEKYYMQAHGSHLMDTAQFLAGPIKSLQARLVRRKDMYNWFIDTCFESGANGHLDLTVAVRMDWHEGFQVYGTEGSVNGKIFNPWYFKTAEVQCFQEQGNTYHQVLDNKAHFFQRQLESFADSILHGNPQTGTTLEEGIETMRLMKAVAQSVRSENRVEIKQVFPH